MDPLSALAIAAAVVQFAEIGGKLIFKSYRKFRDHDNPDSIEEAETEATVAQLRLFTRTMNETRRRITSDAAPSPAETQLVELCKECERIELDLQSILSKIKTRPTKKFRNPGEYLGQGLEELAKLWDRDSKTKLQRDMQKRLYSLRQKTMETIILCLWEDSKQSAVWEVDFSKKMASLVAKLEFLTESSDKPNAKRRNGHEGQTLNSDYSVYSPQSMQESDDAQSSSQQPLTADFARVLSMLSPADKTRISYAFQATFQGQAPVVNSIYQETCTSYWRKDWQPESSGFDSAAAELLPSPIPRDTIKSLIAGLKFETFTGRREAIAQSFQSTYAWIFEPPSAQGPAWDSFPDFLRNPSSSVYWITGKPGSGKSTMMKYIEGNPLTAQYLQSWSGSLPVLIISYYAWVAGHSLQKSWDGLKRTMLYQALDLEPTLIPLVSPRRHTLLQTLPYTRRFPKWERWEVDESFELLLQKCGHIIKLALFIDGLDEFDAPPQEIARLVNNITSISQDTLKVCVASRPWVEFEDAFNHTPMLQMHLLTKNDTKMFVSGQLDEAQGFKELRNIYPQQAETLKSDLVQKSQGVFLWVSVVVRLLLVAVSEGEGIQKLRNTLASLPSEISGLYDAVWASIPDRNRHDGSWMLQIVLTSLSPLKGLTMWIADESRSTQVNIDDLPLHANAFISLPLKRRLMARTRGLLELTGDSELVVQFLHRTTLDWARQDEVFAEIQSSYGEGETVSTCAVLFEAETQALCQRLKDRRSRSVYYFWSDIMDILWYASMASQASISSDRFLDLMQMLDGNMQRLASFGRHWFQGNDPTTQDEPLTSLAAQFSILPYLKAVVSPQTPNRKTSHGYQSLLGMATFRPVGGGFAHKFSFFFHFPLPQRLATVDFLLEAGFLPSKSFWKRMKEERKSPLTEQGWLDFYDEVCALVKSKQGLGGRLKGIVFRRWN